MLKNFRVFRAATEVWVHPKKQRSTKKVFFKFLTPFFQKQFFILISPKIFCQVSCYFFKNFCFQFSCQFSSYFFKNTFCQFSYYCFKKIYFFQSIFLLFFYKNFFFQFSCIFCKNLRVFSVHNPGIRYRVLLLLCYPTASSFDVGRYQLDTQLYQHRSQQQNQP